MYNIDDSNTTIQYFTSSTGIPWNHKVPGIANNSADATRCYDQTYTVNQNLCMQSDMCHFQISFTGSGISVFVIQSNDPLNSSMTIDGSASVIATLPALPGSGNPLVYNATLYTVQSLAETDHTLDIALLNYVYGNGTTKGSMIRFDYAAVSETSPTIVSSPAGTANPTFITPGPPTSTGTSHSALSIGPIIGGAVGGLAVIAAVILALLCYRRRQPSHKAAVLDPQPHPGFDTRQTAFNPSLALYGSQLPSSVEYSQPLTYTTPSRSSAPNSSDYSNDRRANSYLPSVSSGRTHSTSAVPQNNAGRQSNTLSTETQLLAGAHPDTRVLSHTVGSHSTESRPLESQTTGSSSPPPTKVARSSELTEEQAMFINDLRNANVPSAEIAHLMEVMRRQREEALGIGSSHVNPILEAGAPPRYDFKSSD